ncbi:MAG: uridine kinase [Negativicutes bacterium]|jgi:uridine kinase
MNSEVIIIGIAGGSASGKTTVVKKIMDKFGDQLSLIALDSYYRDRSDLTYDERCKINYDHPASLDFDLLIENVKQLKRGQDVDIPVYDFAIYNRVPQVERVQARRIIVVEGILIFAIPELRKLFDIKVFVDAAADVRMMRRLKRDMQERGRSFESVERQYFETVRPMHFDFIEPSKQYADIIIPRGGSNLVAINMLTAKVKDLLDGAKD